MVHIQFFNLNLLALVMLWHQTLIKNTQIQYKSKTSIQPFTHDFNNLVMNDFTPQKDN